MNNSREYRERLNERIIVTHRRDAVPTTTDALLLAAFLPGGARRACELGAGGGIVSLLAAARGRFVYADLVEREGELCELCRRNIRDNGLADRLTVRECDLRHFIPDERYDCVFANPPYRRAREGRPATDRLADISRFERFGTILDFAAAARRLLLPEGSFSVVFPSARRNDLYRALAEVGLFPEDEVCILPYPEGKERIFLLRAVPCAVAEPRRRTMILARSQEDRRPTKEAERLYSDGSLPD